MPQGALAKADGQSRERHAGTQSQSNRIPGLGAIWGRDINAVLGRHAERGKAGEG